jgi:nitrate/nitrite transport system ATP-binding protein
MGYLTVTNVSKRYGTGAGATEVLSQVNLDIMEGEFVAIVGYSGSGKTTLIQTLAGLVRPNEGTVTMGGLAVEGPGPERAIVFQNYSLLPWLSVYGNIALAVEQTFSDWSRAARHDHIVKHIEMVNLGPATHKLPHELSGGMRQRVSLARTLAMDPRVLLMDEPLGALDALTRGVLQGEIERIWRKDRKTCVMITNDVDEAILLADRIIPLTPAPAASLGPSFAVPLARPRDKKTLNHDPAFIRLRNSVTSYLVEVRKKSKEQPQANVVPARPLADLQPVELGSGRRDRRAALSA